MMRPMDLRPDAQRCFLVSDLHGEERSYHALFDLLRADPPDVLFLAGDLLPKPMTRWSSTGVAGEDFVNRYLVPSFATLRRVLGPRYPAVLIVLGNDDARY